jgi:hypothetical protein
MSFWARWDRYSPLAGIKAVVLWVIGIIILSGPGHLGNDSSEAPLVLLAKYKAHHAAIQWGAWFVMLGALAFLWFVGSLRSWFFTAERETGRLSTLVGMGGVATAVGILLAHVPSFAAATTSDNLTAPSAKALILMDDVFFYGAEFASAVFFLAAALSIFRFRALPAWLGWLAVVLGVLAVIPPVGWAVLALGLPIWTLVASWLVFAKQRGAATTPVS